MSVTISVAQVRITSQMLDAEIALNEALIKQSMLFTALLSARRQADIGQFTGQDALLRLTKSQQSLLTAGNDLARVHGRLLEVAKETGQAVDGCPDNWRQIAHVTEEIAA